MKFNNYVAKISYFVLGSFLGFVILLIFVNFKMNNTEALNAKINYQSGCLLMAARIDEKNKIEFDYQKFCQLQSDDVYTTYLDISVQMDKLMGFK